MKTLTSIFALLLAGAIVLSGCDSAPVAQANLSASDVEIVSVQAATPEHPDYPAYRVTARYTGTVDLTSAEVGVTFRDAGGEQLAHSYVVSTTGLSSGEQLAGTIQLMPGTTYDEVACYTYSVAIAAGGATAHGSFDGTCD